MGTYRQPSQLIDKSLGAVSESISEIGSSITKQLQARREAQMKLAKEAKEKQQREFNKFDAKRDKAISDYQVKIDNWEHINQQRQDDWQVEDVSIENQLKDNAEYYLGIMSDATRDSDEYRAAERAIRNMIEQYPIMASLLNQESNELAGAYSPNGEVQLESNRAGALLESNDPLRQTKIDMLHDIKFNRNPERFQILTGPTGVKMIYADPKTGEVFSLNAADYKNYKENGNDLVGVTDGEQYQKFMDGVWDVAGSDYKASKDKLIKYREDKSSGKDIKITEVVESFDQANERLKENITKYIEGQGELSQSEWQMIGGKGVYDPANSKMREEAIDKLFKKQLDMFGKDPKLNFTTQELKQNKSEINKSVQAIKDSGFVIQSPTVSGEKGETSMKYEDIYEAYNKSKDKSKFSIDLLNDLLVGSGGKDDGIYMSGKDVKATFADEDTEGIRDGDIYRVSGSGTIIPTTIRSWTDLSSKMGVATGQKSAIRELERLRLLSGGKLGVEPSDDKDMSNPDEIMVRQQQEASVEDDANKVFGN